MRRAFRGRLVREHNPTGSLDKDYLEDLRKAIRCWDGKEEVKEAVRIKHKRQFSVVNGQQSIVN
jgi:hypothetical protein